MKNNVILSEKRMIWCVIVPVFLLGLHVGIITIHIVLGFSFEIPLLFRLSGTLTAIWVWFIIGMQLSKKYNKNV